MKRFLKTALCLALVMALMTGAAALAASGGNANLYPQTDYDDPDQKYAMSAAGIGGTLYLLVRKASGSNVLLERWTPDMETPETMAESYTYYAYDQEGKPEKTNLSHLFTDGKALYGFDITSRSVRRLVSESGALEDTPLYALDFSSLASGEDASEYAEDVNIGVLSLFADNGVLYLLCETYMEQSTKAFFQFDLETGALLKQEAAQKLRYAAPYRDGKLLALWQEGDKDYNEETGEMIPGVIAEYDPATGAAQPLVTALTYSDTGLRYDAASNTACFISGSTVYSLKDMGAEPTVSAYLPSEAWSGDGQSFLLLEGGLYVYAGYQGVMVRKLDMPGVENGALTIAGDYGTSAHIAAVAAHPELSITVSSKYYGNMEDLTTAMLSGENAVDVIRLTSSNSPLDRLIVKGYAADLSGFADIASVAARMDGRFTEALTRDGKLYGLPVDFSSYTVGYNREVWEETLGLTEDDLPKTFLELVDFIANYYADYGEDHPEISLFGDMQLHTLLLQLAMDQYVALQIKTEGVVSFDTPLFHKLLSALDAVDYTEIDPYAELGDDVWSDDEALNEFWSKPALFSAYCSVQPPQAYSYDANAIPLVLPLDEGQEPVIPVSLDVMIVNPRTTRMDQAAVYLAEYAKHYDASNAALTLFPDNNEPVPNPYFEQNKKSYETSLEDMKKSLEAASEENKAGIREEIKWLEDRLANIENDRMSVTEEMIVKYRELISPYLYVMPQTPLTDWSSESSSELQTQIQQYRDGAIDSETFIREIDKRVKMMMLEDQ